MGPRSSIVAGLLAGVVTAFVVVVAVFALAPEPSGPAPGPSPSAPPNVESSSPPSSEPSATPPPSGPTEPPAPSATAAGGLFHVGEVAPALVVPQVGGGTINLAALRGKPVWVNFMATWCPPCVDEFPLMNGFSVRYADSGLVVLAIDIEEDEGTVAAFAQRLSATFPLGLDTDGAAADAWDAIALPVHFWVDADGIIRDGAAGGIGPDIMARGLGTILPGVDVRP